MSTVTFPIQLQLEKDSNGNITGVEITQDVADTLYQYYVQKLEQDQTFIEAITQGIVNDDNALNTIYNAIKEKLVKDTDFVLRVRYGPIGTQGQAQYQQVYQLFNAMLPVMMLSSMLSAFQPRSGLEHALEALLPILILIPLLVKLS